MKTPDPLRDSKPSRWPLIRDVLVFQLKLMLGNLLNVVLLPVTVVFGIWGVLTRRGDSFYRALDAGRDLEERINIYGAVGGYHATGSSDDPEATRRRSVIAGVDIGDTTVDDVIHKVEVLLLRETGRDGRAAQLKSTLERLLAELRKRR
jgi:hypothetical protein